MATGKKTASTRHTHAGHRERMMEKYKKNGFGAFPDHELLEVVLYYSIPRQNTNEIAHELLEHFSSLEHVVNADLTSLTAVEGIGPHSAQLLNLIGELIRRIAKENVALPKSYSDTEQILSYLQHLYIGVEVEKVHLLLFDNAMKLLSCVCVDEGTVNQARINPSVIAKHALDRNASAVLLAHNHPHGLAIPSNEDIESTEQLERILCPLGIHLLDHLVFAADRYASIRGCISSGAPTKVQNSFYQSYSERHPTVPRQEAQPSQKSKASTKPSSREQASAKRKP